jgi:hypothetical protein
VGEGGDGSAPWSRLIGPAPTTTRALAREGVASSHATDLGAEGQVRAGLLCTDHAVFSSVSFTSGSGEQGDRPIFAPIARQVGCRAPMRLALTLSVAAWSDGEEVQSQPTRDPSHERALRRIPRQPG